MRTPTTIIYTVLFFALTIWAGVLAYTRTPERSLDLTKEPQKSQEQPQELPQQAPTPIQVSTAEPLAPDLSSPTKARVEWAAKTKGELPVWRKDHAPLSFFTAATAGELIKRPASPEILTGKWPATTCALVGKFALLRLEAMEQPFTGLAALMIPIDKLSDASASSFAVWLYLSLDQGQAAMARQAWLNDAGKMPVQSFDINHPLIVLASSHVDPWRADPKKEQSTDMMVHAIAPTSDPLFGIAQARPALKMPPVEDKETTLDRELLAMVRARARSSFEIAAPGEFVASNFAMAVDAWADNTLKGKLMDAQGNITSDRVEILIIDGRTNGKPGSGLKYSVDLPLQVVSKNPLMLIDRNPHL